jgi:Asp-tRNA(Asn)/Glu-tRNA(Gln) amidotransferase A subunit family amidase
MKLDPLPARAIYNTTPEMRVLQVNIQDSISLSTACGPKTEGFPIGIQVVGWCWQDRTYGEQKEA